MATISKKVCDRCGKEVRYIGWTTCFKNKCIRKSRKVKIREYYNGNLGGYNYIDKNFELCSDCTKELEQFLYSKPVE